MVFINLVPVRAGGGMQNALSFLSLLKESECFNGCYVISCTRKSFIEAFCIENNMKFVAIREGVVSRAFYEICQGYYLARNYKAQVVFSLFGGAPVISPGFYKISGFAYSNIIQSDIDFWGFLPPVKKFLKRMIDCLRLHLALQSDEIIVETPYLVERSKDSVFSEKAVHVIEMAPSFRVLRGLANREDLLCENYAAHLQGAGVKVLYLSGPHPNKRIELLADVFLAIRQAGLDFKLVTTLPADSDYYKVVLNRFELLGIRELLINLGPVPPDEVSSVLPLVDAVINVALLESFSNNWVEAWAARKPLIVTDAEWARRSCRKAAVYIDPEEPGLSAMTMIEVFNSDLRISQLVAAGAARLNELPTPAERFGRYVDIIEAALTATERREQ